MGQSNLFAINQQQVGEKEEKKFHIRLDLVLLIILGFFMGQAEMFSGLFPLALVYWAIAGTINYYMVILVTITTGLGLIYSGNILNLMYIFAGLIGFALSKTTGKWSKVNFPLSISLIYLVSSLSLAFLQEALPYRYFLALGESVMIYILIMLGREGLQELLNEDKKLTRLAVITLYMITSGTLIGLANLGVIPQPVINAIVLTFVAGMAYRVGFSYGIVTAVLYGLVMVLAGLGSSLNMAKFVIFALTSGIFHRKKKYFMLIGFFLAFFIYSGLSPTLADLQNTALEFILAVISFFLIPVKFWDFALGGFKGSPARVKGMENQQVEITRSIKEHLIELGNVFQELSTTFEEAIPDEDSNNLGDFAYIFRNKICKSCQRYMICWRQEKRKTYLALKSMVKKAEEKGRLSEKILEETLGRQCPFTKRIMPGARSSYELYQLNNFWKERMEEKQRLVSQQLAGVGEIIDHFADTRPSLKVASSLNDIKKKAWENDIDIYNIELNKGIDNRKHNLTVEMDPCAGNKPCANQMIELLSSEFGHDFRIVSRECGEKLKDRPCQIVYGMRGNYNLNISYLQKASRGDISGDNFLYKPLKDGKDLIVLSDGMGVGKKAALESKAATKLLERIIDAGFNQELAIKTINSALYLRKEDESFTTLDIGIFDTFTGEMTFTKIGAVASYIKRGWDLIKINSSSLPAGILDSIEISSRSLKLQKDDFVIMFTDGLLDSRKELEDKEEWFTQLLQSTSFDTPQDLAQYITEVIRENNGRIKDDMTLVVVKVEEIRQKRRMFQV